MSTRLTRRRAIGVTAAAGLSLVPLVRGARAEPGFVTWRGLLMGAAVAPGPPCGPDHRGAWPTQGACGGPTPREDLQPLSRGFRVSGSQPGGSSSPRPETSSSCSENAAAIGSSRAARSIPTVQALWVVYRDHFSRTDHDSGGPSAAELRAALDKVGFHHVAVNEHRIVLGRRGMGLTLNGIAQGYMTDRATEVLRSAGIERSLADRAASWVIA